MGEAVSSLRRTCDADLLFTKTGAHSCVHRMTHILIALENTGSVLHPFDPHQQIIKPFRGHEPKSSRVIELTFDFDAFGQAGLNNNELRRWLKRPDSMDLLQCCLFALTLNLDPQLARFIETGASIASLPGRGPGIKNMEKRPCIVAEDSTNSQGEGRGCLLHLVPLVGSLEMGFMRQSNFTSDESITPPDRAMLEGHQSLPPPALLDDDYCSLHDYLSSYTSITFTPDGLPLIHPLFSPLTPSSLPSHGLPPLIHPLLLYSARRDQALLFRCTHSSKPTGLTPVTRSTSLMGGKLEVGTSAVDDCSQAMNFARAAGMEGVVV